MPNDLELSLLKCILCYNHSVNLKITIMKALNITVNELIVTVISLLIIGFGVYFVSENIYIPYV